MLLPRHLDVAVRVGWINPSLDLDDDRFVSGEAQIAWYIHAPALIVKLRYGIGDRHRRAALGDVTLPVAVGRTQVVDGAGQPGALARTRTGTGTRTRKR